ncbi:MAG: hypothetical protein KC549_14315 [Myxococcales bacterium]|nr:hypothetical protein [Myxococcales bacterium]
MNTLKLLTLALLLPACEQDLDAASDAGADDAGLPRCIPDPVQSMGGGYDFVRTEGFVSAWSDTREFDGEATFRGVVDGVAVWDSTEDVPALRMSALVLEEGQQYRITYRAAPLDLESSADSWTATAISLDDQLVLFAASGRLHMSGAALALLGVTATWSPRCTARIPQACYVPSTHFDLDVKTTRGEVGRFPLGAVTRWESELGHFEVFLEEAVDGGDNDQGCSHTSPTSFWLTMRAVP